MWGVVGAGAGGGADAGGGWWWLYEDSWICSAGVGGGGVGVVGGGNAGGRPRIWRSTIMRIPRRFRRVSTPITHHRIPATSSKSSRHLRQ